jgi:hypothetical protein
MPLPDYCSIRPISETERALRHDTTAVHTQAPGDAEKNIANRISCTIKPYDRNPETFLIYLGQATGHRPSNGATDIGMMRDVADEGDELAVHEGFLTPPMVGKGDRGTKSKPIPGPHKVYGFLTTSPNAVVEPVHAKAMPVIPTLPPIPMPQRASSSRSPTASKPFRTAVSSSNVSTSRF